MVKKLCRIAIIIIAIPSIALSQNLPDLTALSETIKPQVSSTRSLNFVQPFTIRYRTNAEITTFINSAFDQSVPQVIRQNYDLLIRTIGLHHGGIIFDFETMKKTLLEQVGAYYDPANHSVNFPIGPISPQELRIIIAHELTHVLQDQHFGLDHLLDSATNSDQILAHQALAEGDATLVQFLWSFNRAGQAIPDAELQRFINNIINTAVNETEEIPDFLFEEQIATYFRGMNFVFALKKRGGWATVNRAYTTPPMSMEHILHPDKYFAGESLEEISLPDLANEPFAGDWELLDKDTLGELGLRIIFNTFDVNTPSHSAAAGWHGDQYAVFKHRQDNTPALVLFTTWDTERDATEFKTAYEDILAIKRRGATDFRIEQRGTDVLIAESSRDLDLLFAYLKKVRFTPTVALGAFDFDGDLVIGFTDFLLFAAHFGKSSSDPDFDPRFDIDADGMVGFSDFLAFASAFGKQITPNSKPAVVIDPHIIHRTLGFVR
ncbi:MAG: hypothetical protein J4F29_12090 [Candidatus Latescibacteria bacterium]|nr:hypothetical protein [Candidatus Latescibacterota bacterium]